MKVRIGIDVGGTFTDVVVIDQQTRELVGQLKLPTTHHAEEGVALGIVRALERALHDFAIAPENVVFIAHSTTQATNALLEGDVARVVVVAGGEGVEGWLARRATRVPPIRLTPQRSLVARQVWLGKDLAPPRRWLPWREWQGRQKRLRASLEGLAAEGVEVIVASSAFGVDQPESEALLAGEARLAGMLATSGHEVSSLYGLRVRTRTAVINAAILPKMIETAGMTERCVRETGIESPLMIMRSDGGVMSVGEVRRRPILTMLSGPAAGIAGALMHERISDGIFIEVGGTSADISVIRDGSPATRPARLNGHRMYLNTLDVRTLGVGGGSMIRVRAADDLTIADVGPRSAHIAGLGYVCFTDPDRLAGATIEVIQPTERDECDHVVVRTHDGQRIALTTTCAANLLGLVGADHFARGRADSAEIAFGLLAERQGQGQSAAEAARQVLQQAGQKIAATIEDLIVEYQLARDQVVLVGGGGGAAALVPFAASLMGLEHRLARNAEVISPIGVAMAMVRDSIERNIVDPTPDEILAVRREATEAAINSGALPASVEVQVEVDKRRNLVRAVAMGTTELRRRDGEVAVELDLHGCQAAAARSMRLGVDQLQRVATTDFYLVFTATHHLPSPFTPAFLSNSSLAKSIRRRWGRAQMLLRVVDRSGVVRLQRGHSIVVETRLAELEPHLARVVDRLTDYGDAGRTIPDIFILQGRRILNLSGLVDLAQVVALVEVELRGLDPETPLVVIASPKQV